ncbi:hypothetical protein [Chryseobacterium sp. ISL-6]|uniref:hypothetical protein n=1 Tax=Chryseobacterium sp. ISL-6 TaxID=2819143 RepID=UPI001BE61871|nr:hypothetical protein [Chryseobacterium sp. ISL-6]MBT2620592.1 hypothetical protein [Chryseobacterium sp. ISL-6]
MAIKDILSKENGKIITFYKNGSWWIAYEQSAYCLWQIGEFVPLIKQMKYLRRNILSIHFHNMILDDIINKLSVYGKVNQEKDRIQVILSKKVSQRGFVNWKESVCYRGLKENILAFSLETKTSVEAYQFLRKVQISLNNQL